ncbi:hypothetical protein CISIN_1g029637mg [Citrus sinensis]|nr:hypothetical protein CISIN_1g029637mg [Citrus sinensis]
MTFKVQTLSFSTKTSLKISKGDISRWCVDRSSDAIVSPTNEILLLGGFTAAAIHEAAGPDLQKACYQIPEAQPRVRCPPGEARITPGFKLPVSHVIHTVGPVFNFHCNPEDILRSAYKYPPDEAATIAISTVKEFANDFKEVHFILFTDDIYNVWLKKAKELLQG